ncbi:pentapeptide repeat-containing protein [Dactylosporangium sp. NPDC048998]|uniref:pentapeptide repeat-containing protein n=1 Tax=Dactylosporangium sp. NPDC048998 TaxID=3363976 RepID=UPI0037179C67
MPILRCLAGAAAALLAAVLFTGGPAAAAPSRGPTCPETRADVAGLHFTDTAELPDLTCADLHGAVFDGLDMAQVSFAGADAHGASFRHTRLIQATFTGADLRDADFGHADLGQADLNDIDARGARFGHAYLGQADLSHADLRGADLLDASLVQADLTGADLRTARTFWTNSTQADLSGVRVDLTDPRNFQVGILALVAGLLILVRAVVAALRGRAGGAGPIGLTVLPAVGFLIAGGFSCLMGSTMFPLLFVVVWYPLLGGAGLVLLGSLIRRYAPIRKPPAPTPFEPQASTINPWS